VGTTTLPGVGAFKSHDLVRFVPTSLGANTAGAWSMHFDGSDVGLAHQSQERLDAGFPREDGSILLSTRGNLDANGFAASRGDLVAFHPASTGDATSGWFDLYRSAAQMGLPIERLIVATNINDILHRALSSGDYSASTVTPTSAPSMDIQVSSNFERLLYDAGGRDGAATMAQMKLFETTKAMKLTNAQRESAAALFTSARTDAAEMSGAMRWAHQAAGEVLDPHTGIGLHAARVASGLPADVPVVTLATAHPAKFRDAVERATGIRPSLPTRMGDLFEREEAYTRLPGDYDTVRAWIAERATPKVGLGAG
jgi:threonine synthase